MDIAKYIGLFLLKNNFCYVHGLGNMELKKKLAMQSGKELLAPSYEVVVTPGGSIDDNLANFIATNEQISISKAANALRDFSIQARTDMAAGMEVSIPNIGRFSEQNNRVKFITDDNFRFTPAGVPVIRNSKQLEEQISKPAHKPSYPPPQKADSVNWSMVVIVAVLLIIVGGGVFGIYYYTNSNKNNAPVAAPTVAKDTVVQVHPQPVTVPVDSMKKDSATATAVSVPPATPIGDSLTVNTYRMIIGEYKLKDRAEKRLQTLIFNGNHVEMLRNDSTRYLIATHIRCKASDTVHVEDSLRRMFGYKGVMIIK